MIDQALERAVKALLISRGAVLHANECWPETVEQYEAMCAKYPDYADSRSLVTDAFRDARAVMAAVDRWETISMAPNDGTPVLLGFPNNMHAMHGHCEDGIWGQLDSDFGFEHLPTQPTHWQPLPRSPNKGE